MKNVIVKELKKRIPQNIWEFLKAHKALVNYKVEITD